MATIAATESPLTGSAWSTKLRTSAWSEVVRGRGGGVGGGGGSGYNPSSSSPEQQPTTKVTQSPPQSPQFKPPPSPAGALEPPPPVSLSGSKPLSTPPPTPVQTKQQPLSSEGLDSSGGGEDNNNVGTVVKKSPWGKPSNCSFQAPAPVMGASSWPDLVECTRPVVKSSVDSSKLSADGSGGLKPAAAAASQETPPISKPPNKHRDNAVGKSNYAQSYNPGRQRQVRRGGGVNRHSGQVRPPNTPPSNHSTYPQHNAAAVAAAQTVPFGPFVPPPAEIGATGGGFPPYVHPNYPRRNNFGPYSQRDGAGARNDFDQVPNGWNYGPAAAWVNRGGFYGTPRVSGGRGLSPTGPAFPSYFGPTPVMRPHGNAFAAYPDSPAMMYFAPPSNHLVPMPYSSPAPSPPPVPVAPAAPIPPLPDPKATSVSNQINYYFSDENLEKDGYLKSNMDEEGWVPLTLIASFRRIKNMNVSIPFIVESLKLSNLVEVKDDRIRRRHGWAKWVPEYKCSQSTIGTGSSVGTAGTSPDELISSMKNASLDEGTKESA